VEKNLSTGTTRYIYRSDKDQGSVFRGLRFSRDHEWIAFQEDNTRIVIFHPETGTKKVLAEEGFEAPAWSPDGRHLVVIGGKENNNGLETEMFFLSVEDGSVTKIDLGKNLPQGAGLRSPDWSPDGTKIVFETMVAMQGVQLMRNVIPDERR
jgi:Tol biopolymer transport system component